MVLLASIPWQVLGEVATSEEISRINDLGGEGQGPPVTLDPRLRRALLRVLTRLEEAERKNQQHQESARNIAEVMQNIVTEYDFVRYFQEHGLEQELIDEFQPKDQSGFEHKDDNNPPRNDEILSFSSEDSKPSEKPFTFASYPEDKKETTTPDVLKEIPNEPATNPTPPLGEAIYFQIPEPIRVPDAINDDEESGGFNLQETRSIQGPTFPSPSEHVFTIQEEEKRSEDDDQRNDSDATNQPDKDDPSINFIPIRVEDGPVKITLQKEEDDNTTNTTVDIHASNVTEVENTEDSENSTTKVKMEKHEVEFLHSSLLTAFTVQQDQQGLPRRVIPLNYQLSGDPIPLPNNQNQHLNPLKDRRNELEEQVKFLQGHQLQEQQYKKLQDFVQQRQRLLAEEAQRQQYLENQKRQLENAARLRQQQILFQQPDNQLDILKEIERQRVLSQQQQNIQQQQQNIVHQNSIPQNNFPLNNAFQNSIPQNNIQHNNVAQNNFLHNGFTPNVNQNQQQQKFQQSNFQQFQSFQPSFPLNQPQNINFQKSVDFQFQPNFQQHQPQLVSSFKHQNSFQQPFSNFVQPSAATDLNRVNRHEPSNFVGNFGVSSSQNQNVNFQPSVSVELNRVNRQESSNFVGNFGVSPSQNQNFNYQGRTNYQSFSQPSSFLQQQRIPPPLTLDSQLQSLFSISGIANGKPQEDLNIISKVLALGHPEQEVLGRQQFQASTIHEQIVKPPSRVIEPPTL